MIDSDDDRRIFSRILFDGDTQLIQNNQQWSVKMLDISFKGLLLEIPSHWQADTNQPFQVKIQLNSDIEINMTVLWRHSNEGHAGFICQHIDIDSFTHLRRLVELNLASDQLLKREFSALSS